MKKVHGAMTNGQHTSPNLVHGFPGTVGQGTIQLVHDGHLLIVSFCAQCGSACEGSEGVLLSFQRYKWTFDQCFFEADAGDVSSPPSCEVARLADVCFVYAEWGTATAIKASWKDP